MRYWLTIHWPPRGTDENCHDIYLKAIHKEAGATLRPGDLVLIYEIKGRSDGTDVFVDGTDMRVNHLPGRQGIIGVFEVTTALEWHEGAGVHHSDDGLVHDWEWVARTRLHDEDGFVPRERLNKLLGYKPGNIFRGFGDKHSGLKELDERTFRVLQSEFKRHPKPPHPRGSG